MRINYDPKLNFEDVLLEPSKHNIAGIPVAIKDIFNTKSLPTQMGSQIWKNFMDES